MLSVIRINTLYLQTVLIKQLGPASKYRMQISNTFTENLMFSSAKANENLETKYILSIYRKEPKQCINTWQTTEVSSSGNHANLGPLKISATADNSTWCAFINTSEATKKVKLPNREQQMYKCHEAQESCTASRSTPFYNNICLQIGHCKFHGQPSEQNGNALFGDRSSVYPKVKTQAHNQETE